MLMIHLKTIGTIISVITMLALMMMFPRLLEMFYIGCLVGLAILVVVWIYGCIYCLYDGLGRDEDEEPDDEEQMLNIFDY